MASRPALPLRPPLGPHAQRLNNSSYLDGQFAHRHALLTDSTKHDPLKICHPSLCAEALEVQACGSAATCSHAGMHFYTKPT